MEPNYQRRYKAASICGTSNYLLRRMIDKGEVALHLIDGQVCVDINEVNEVLKGKEKTNQGHRTDLLRQQSEPRPDLFSSAA